MPWCGEWALESGKCSTSDKQSWVRWLFRRYAQTPTRAWFSQISPGFPHELPYSPILVFSEMASWHCVYWERPPFSSWVSSETPGLLLELWGCTQPSSSGPPLQPPLAKRDLSSICRLITTALGSLSSQITASSRHIRSTCFSPPCIVIKGSAFCSVLSLPGSCQSSLSGAAGGQGGGLSCQQMEPQSPTYGLESRRTSRNLYFCLVWGFSLSQSLPFMQVALWIHGSLKIILNGLYSNHRHYFLMQCFCCSIYVSTFPPNFLPNFLENFQAYKNEKKVQWSSSTLYIGMPVVNVLPCWFSPPFLSPARSLPPHIHFLLKPLTIVCRHNDTSLLHMSAWIPKEQLYPLISP